LLYLGEGRGKYQIWGQPPQAPRGSVPLTKSDNNYFAWLRSAALTTGTLLATTCTDWTPRSHFTTLALVSTVKLPIEAAGSHTNGYRPGKIVLHIMETQHQRWRHLDVGSRLWKMASESRPVVIYMEQALNIFLKQLFQANVNLIQWLPYANALVAKINDFKMIW